MFNFLPLDLANPGPRAENAKKTDKLAGSLAKMAERMPKSRK
jgi:hypothetical protein